jgi:hypothetical protein
MDFPDVNHELSNDGPDVMSMHHMGTAVEEIGTP